MMATLTFFSKNEAIINVMMVPGSLSIGRKSNTHVIQQVSTQNRCITGRWFPQDMRNDSMQMHSSRVFATFQSSTKEEVQPVLDTTSNIEEQHKNSFLFRTEFGGLVKVFVRTNDLKYTVDIVVQSLPKPMIDHNLVLCWGLFRSDSSQLYGSDSHISISCATEFKLEASQHAMRTPFVRGSSFGHRVGLVFNSSEIPFYLSFLLQPDGTTSESRIRTHRKTNFCVPVGLGPGYPMPFGFSFSNGGSGNFSLFSRNAKGVVLCLYNGKTTEPSLEIELDPYINRTGDIWHVSIPNDNIANYVNYGYRCKGEILWDTCGRFHAPQVLLDPYAKMIGNISTNRYESVSLAKYLGCLWKEPNFDWSGDAHPQIPMEKLVIYRLNVGQFTKNESSGLPKNAAGTFTGLIQKLQHLVKLGVNAVLLEPIFPFDEKRGPYFPYHFFSPMNTYGNVDESVSAVYLMKEMVKTLHGHGMEVLLEVVFTHTCEGGDADCQTISFRGIDNSSYYKFCGNGSSETSELKCNDHIVQQMILDSLHHWLTEFHVDGFCFINSSSLPQGSYSDLLPRSPLIEAIAFDPLLSKTKIISDCWSPLEMSFKDVTFPHWNKWAEMNTKFFRDVRNYLKGEGMLSDLATRLCGSGDIFTASRGPAYSFNFITKNVGLTLVDLVSFSGSDVASELSWNCGEEGPTDKSSVLEIRLRQIRNFLFILFISLGVPVINMGDELGYSTGGSPSCKDRVPIDWSNLRTEFGIQTTKFIAFLTALRRRRSDVFQSSKFLNIENITWHGSNQSLPKWEDPSSKFLAMEIKAENDVRSPNSYKGDLLISFNAGDLPEVATLPELPEGYIWHRLVDTALAYPGFFTSDSDSNSKKHEGLSSYELKPHSCALFETNSINL